MLAAWELVVRWRRAILAALLLAALVGGYCWWKAKVEARVEERVNAGWIAKEKKISEEAEAKYQLKLVAALEKQKLLMEEDNRMAAERATWEKSHEENLEKHTTALLSGIERMRVPVRIAADPVPGGAEGPVAGLASGPGPAQAVDLLPETAAAILRIAADSAGDVRAYNDLLARYKMIEAACRPPQTTPALLAP